jgi:hypothetical protein
MGIKYAPKILRLRSNPEKGDRPHENSRISKIRNLGRMGW